MLYWLCSCLVWLLGWGLPVVLVAQPAFLFYWSLLVVAFR